MQPVCKKGSKTRILAHISNFPPLLYPCLHEPQIYLGKYEVSLEKVAFSGVCSRFNPGGGAFEILSLPGGWAFVYPRDYPGAIDTLVRFWSRT